MCSTQAVGAPIRHNVELCGVEQGKARKRMVLPLQIEKVGGHRRLVLKGHWKSWIGGPEVNKAISMWVRQRSYQDCVDQAENRGAGANAEGEGEDSHSCEPGRPAKHTNAKAQVLPPRLHQGFPAGSLDDFLRRVLAAHPLLHFFINGHIQVGAQLLIQLPVNLFLFGTPVEARPLCLAAKQPRRSSTKMDHLQSPSPQSALGADLNKMTSMPLLHFGWPIDFRAGCRASNL